MMDVFGLRASNGLPVCELLLRGHANESHENLIEIARRHWRHDLMEGSHFNAIMIILNHSEEAHVYTEAELLR